MPGNSTVSNTTDFDTLAHSPHYSSINTRRPGSTSASKHDKHTDYFQNSIIATDVHRRFCLELAKQYPVL